MRILRPKYPAPGRLFRLRRRCPAVAVGAIVAVTALAAGCGSNDSGARNGDSALTIYTSLPHSGLSGRSADAVADGERLALDDARGRAGGRRVRLVELDSSAPGADTWDPGTVDANARRAANDATAVAYIGELDYGGSAISLPDTNDAGLLQVAPTDGYTTLTVPDPGLHAEGPERYYPRDRRTFIRLVPADYLQARTLVAWAHDDGVHSIAIVREDRLFGRALADEAGAAAAGAHMRVTTIAEARHGQPDYSDVARELTAHPADAVIYTGLGGPSADGALAAVHQALPRARLYGTSGLAAGGVNLDGVTVERTDPALPADRYGPAARRVLARLRAARGAPTSAEALYGYQAMQIVLSALDAAGDDSDDRAAVVRAAMRPRVLPPTLGEWSLVRTGDVTPARFGAYRQVGRRTEFLGLRGPDGPISPRR